MCCSYAASIASSMIGTRAKRHRPEEEGEERALSEAAVLAAVEARRADVLHHAATVSTSMLLGWLRQDLSLHSEAEVAALRTHRAAARRRALELLEEQVTRADPCTAVHILPDRASPTHQMHAILGCEQLSWHLLLHFQGQVPVAPPPAGLGDLPPELLPAVFFWLEHDSLFCALQVSRSWRSAGAQPELWEQLCRARGWGPPARAGAPQAGQPAVPQPLLPPQQDQRPGLDPEQSPEQQLCQQQPHLQLGHQQEEAPPLATHWRLVYRQRYAAVCYDCFQPTARHTLMAGSLRVRLCRGCSQGYESPRPAQRLMSATHAKRQCCLRDAGRSQGGSPACASLSPVLHARAVLCRATKRRLHLRRMALLAGAELATLPRCVEPDPASPAFAPMHLFRWARMRGAGRAGRVLRHTSARLHRM